MSSRIAILVAGLFAAALSSLAAQSAPPAPAQDPQRPKFRTEANFVRVDVFPTRSGAPVKNLTAADFEVLEDGVRQKVETFEFVQVRTGAPQEERREPNTIGEMREAMRDPRARVFVLFLDVPHVRMLNSMVMREPLVRLIDRVLGPDDLVGIMTPMMASSDVVFARKTQVMASGLRDRWPWGERFSLAEDEREILYQACYPWGPTKEVVAEMTARRRERITLDSLYDLVNWLRDEREERKAVLTVSEGWALFRPNMDLTRPRIIDPATGAYEPIPGPEPIGTGPDGRLRIGHESNRAGTKGECDRDRVYLSQMDNDRYFRDIIGAANRANASFYTVDPRGLAVFDAPLGPAAPPPLQVDMANLRHRIETLQTLAEATDGLAAVNSNDIDKGLRRITDDLSSYYLLGYYSTNTKLDGQFRNIAVKVKQPGIDVRARRGYKAPTEREVTEARAAASAPVPEHVTIAHGALAGLGRLRPASTFSVHAIAVQGDVTTVWVAGEMKVAAPAAGAAEISVSAGSATSTASAVLAAGQRGFVVPVTLEGRMTEPLTVRVRVPQGPGRASLTDMLKIDAVAGLPHALLYRRGPSTGNRVQPAGSPAFSRTERARFEIPAEGDAKLTGSRVLDRNGGLIELPVTLAERTDEAGQRWLTAEVVLAPLAAGDYIVELSGTVSGAEQKVLTAIRVSR
jgi:VWFA-related protein